MKERISEDKILQVDCLSNWDFQRNDRALVVRSSHFGSSAHSLSESFTPVALRYSLLLILIYTFSRDLKSQNVFLTKNDIVKVGACAAVDQNHAKRNVYSV